jgi:hypothetical protein
MVDRVFNAPWTRKHDDPRFDFIPAAPEIDYPKSLTELIELCKNRPPNQRLKAAGSHWALSQVAISDHAFIETHDPRNVHEALTDTLHEVVPGCLNSEYLDHMVAERPGNLTYLIHVEAGKRIYQLYSELDQQFDFNGPEDRMTQNDRNTLAWFIKEKYQGNKNYAGPWALSTMGAAGGQTIVGAFSTGTHGGDFDRPPIADSVMAIHLVVDGGKHYWIEPKSGLPLTDKACLKALYGTDEYGGADNFMVLRDDDIFNSVLVSVGRFGVIYSVVLRAVEQYYLHERRRVHIWQDIKNQIKERSNGPLYQDPSSPQGNTRFLQVAVCLTPHFNFQRNLVGITKRWPPPTTPQLIQAAPGRAERRGDRVDGGNLNNPTFTLAGKEHTYRNKEVSFIERACSDGSFVKGILEVVIDKIERFVTSNGIEVGAGIAAIAAAGGGGLLSLIPALALILLVLRELLNEFGDDTKLAEVLEKIKNELLDPNEPNPFKRAAGLFVWHFLAYELFNTVQGDEDYDGISYAVMDQHDYKMASCEVNVDSAEIFFDAIDDRLITFIDALIAFEIQQEFNGKACLGYASLRFMGPTRALLGMQRWVTTCSVEVACIRGMSGSQELVDYAVRLALDSNINGFLHWGQRNDYTRSQVEFRYGPALNTWRTVLGLLSNGGQLDGFSNDFTRRTGLEVS